MLEVQRLDKDLKPTGETLLQDDATIEDYLRRVFSAGWAHEEVNTSVLPGHSVYKFTLGSQLRKGSRPLPRNMWQTSYRAIRVRGKVGNGDADGTQIPNGAELRMDEEPAGHVACDVQNIGDAGGAGSDPAGAACAPAAVTNSAPDTPGLEAEYAALEPGVERDARIEQAYKFLTTLFAGYPLDQGLTCEIRCLPDDISRNEGMETEQHWFGIEEEYLLKAAEFAVARSEGSDVYAGVLPRRGRSGHAKAVPLAGWVWAEIDRGSGSNEDVKALIQRAGRIGGENVAQMCVQSGSGGGHMYWRLSSLVSVETDEERERFSALLAGLVKEINEVARFNGAPVHVSCSPRSDSTEWQGAHADPACVDVARILRVPGTLNHKWDPPAAVRLARFNAGAQPVEWWKGRLPFCVLPLAEAQPGGAGTRGAGEDHEWLDTPEDQGVVADAGPQGGTPSGDGTHEHVLPVAGGTAGDGSDWLDEVVCPGVGGDAGLGDSADRGDGGGEIRLSSGHVASSYQAAILRFQETGDGHGMVNAVAGSGKTSTLVEMANRRGMHERGSALFVAFNRHIAEELKQRLPADVEARTIHSAAMRALIQAVQPPQKEGWVQANKYRSLVRDYFKSKNVNTFKRRDLVDIVEDTLGFVMYTLSACREFDILKLIDRYELRVPDDLPVAELVEAVQTVMLWGYQGTPDGTFLGLKQAVSFDDMVYYAATMDIPLRTYRTLYVDESQDLNAMQREFVLKLLDPRGRAMFVGDPKQSIYGFAGADTESFARIRQRTQAKEMPLSICYRCPASHVAIAKEIVPEIEAAPGAPQGEIEGLRSDELHAHARPADLVLCRMTAPLVMACFELLRRRIPAIVRGKEIGRQLTHIVDSLEDGTLNASFDEFPRILDSYRSIQLRMLLQREDNEMAIEMLNDKCDTLDVIWHRAYGEDNVRTWDAMRDYINNLFADDRAGVVTLSTVHKAKGLEADNVFLLRPELMPHPRAKSDWQREQEFNLRYVALTRAKKRLTFVETIR